MTYAIEPIDQCLERNIISGSQHEAAIRLRKLHDAIFGAARITAYNFAPTGRSCRKIDELRLQIQQNEYNHLVQLLSQKRMWTVVSDICIYQSPVSFLLGYGNYIQKNNDLCTLQEGLDLLLDYFNRKKQLRNKPIGNRLKRMDRFVESLGIGNILQG